MAEADTDIQFDRDKCVICLDISRDCDEKHIEITAEGLETLTRYSKLRGNDKLYSYLCNCKDKGGKVLVHQRCRRNFTDSKRKILEDVHGVDLYSKKVNLRSQQTSFDWKSNCFLCGRHAIVDTRHPDRNDVQIVATILSTTVDISTKKRTTFREKILNICMLRSDFWASQVESRLQNCIDLVAEEAVYHKSCYCKFISDKSLGNSENKVVGRPENKDMLAIFTKLCEWLESEAELYTLSELHQK